jgi:CHAT domain-containing protein/lipopolysaccharide biosynthesis regulator YciM
MKIPITSVLFSLLFCSPQIVLSSPLPALETGSSNQLISQAADQKELKAEAIYKSAEALEAKGETKAALSRYQEARTAYKKEANLFGELLSIVKIANFNEREGNLQVSLELYQQILSSLQAANQKVFVVTALTKIGFLNAQLGNHAKAVGFYQQAIAENPEPKQKGTILTNLSVSNLEIGKPELAEKIGKEAVGIFRQLESKAELAVALSNLGQVYSQIARYSEAIKIFEEALVLRKQVGDRIGEATTLNNLASVYSYRAERPKAIQLYEQAAIIFRELKDLRGEASTLNNLAYIYDDLGDFKRALTEYQKALAIREQLKDNAQQAVVLNNIAAVYAGRGKIDRAIKIYEKVLKLSDRPATQVTTLSNLALAYRKLGSFPKSIEISQKVIELRRNLSDRAGEAISITNLGDTYQRMGQYERALSFYNQGLKIVEEIGANASIPVILNNIAITYGERSEYAKQIENLNRSLEISRSLGQRASESTTLNNLGTAYKDLGQYDRSISIFKQALEIENSLGNPTGKGIVFNNIAASLDYQQKYKEALSYYQQAEVILKNSKEKYLHATVLRNIGLIYSSIKEPEKALDFLQQAQTLSIEVADRVGQGAGLQNLASLFRDRANYTKSIDYSQSALAIFRETGNREAEAKALSGIATTLEKQNRIELSILFYKQSVNLYEVIRKDLGVLPKQDQGSYRQTITKTYRSLAGLLLQKDRIIEGLQVLDLLKVQELQDYLNDVQANDRTAKGIELLVEESQIIAGYKLIESKIIKNAQKINQLRESVKPDQAQINQLENNQTSLSTELNQFLTNIKLNPTAAAIPSITKDLQARLKKLEQDSKQKVVLFYPLILEDRLELVLLFSDSPPIRRSVKVKQSEFEAKIKEFRANLLDLNSQDIKGTAIALNKWLIEPVSADLQKNQVTTILYAPDGIMRYIPLAALNDGTKWLTERYQINYISAINLTDFQPRPEPQPRILAGAFSQGEYKLDVNGQKYALKGLTFAGKEVEELTATKKATALFNIDFSRDRLLSQVNNSNSYNILHLATHAAFVSGNPENSFIILGNGEYISLREIKNLNFANLKLVVLSACETALGGLGNGEEILGFGYQMQRAKAQAAIASLWSVSDGGTQILMEKFYQQLFSGKSTIQSLSATQAEMLKNPKYKHPFYWASFIVIGNGL